jgi:hypothetical protein
VVILRVQAAGRRADLPRAAAVVRRAVPVAGEVTTVVATTAEARVVEGGRQAAAVDTAVRSVAER